MGDPAGVTQNRLAGTDERGGARLYEHRHCFGADPGIGREGLIHGGDGGAENGDGLEAGGAAGGELEKQQVSKSASQRELKAKIKRGRSRNLRQASAELGEWNEGLRAG